MGCSIISEAADKGLKRLAILFGLACSAAVISGCAVYHPQNFLAGIDGYKDTRVNANTYAVEFKGRSNTTKEQVGAYWVYRCAALTKEHNFKFFRVQPHGDAGNASLGDEDGMLRASDDGAPADLIGAKGGGGGGYSFIYVPGASFTYWRSSGTIEMFNSPDEAPGGFAMNAESVMAALQPFIDTQGRSGLLNAQQVVDRALQGPLGGYADYKAAPVTPAKAGGPHVEMSDLAGLLK